MKKRISLFDSIEVLLGGTTDRARVQRPVMIGAALTGALLVPSASAVGESYSLDLTAPITSFGSAMTSTITTNSPALFGILAISVGFFFLWGRVRALF